MPITAIIEIKAALGKESGATHSRKGFDDLAARIYRFDEVMSVYLMSGAYDLSVVVAADTTEEISRFVDKLSRMESVVRFSTHYVHKKYKEAGVVLVEETQEGDRGVFSP